MNQEEVLELFMKTRAIQQGHFELSSGYHTDTYYQCAQIFQHPSLTEKLGDEIARLYRSREVEVVISPAVGAIVLGFAVALSLGCRAIFTEREEGKMTLRRGFKIVENEKVLVVDDVITTGNSVGEIVGLVKKSKGKVIGIASLLNRGKKQQIGGVRLRSLLRVDPTLWKPADCPLCQEKVPIVSPGSRRLL